MFVHRIEDLVGKVSFDNVKLRAVNVPIKAEVGFSSSLVVPVVDLFLQSLFAEHADIASVNAPVEGRFDVTDELVIETANSPIKVLVNAFNADKDATTKVDLKTSNG